MGMKTASISTKWIVEVYPFDSEDPASSDFLPSQKPKISVTGSKGSSPFIQNLKKKELIPEDAEVNNLGITNIAISRSKGSPDGECTLTAIGPLHPSLIGGSWVVVSTASVTNGKPKYIMRFIGQIKSVDVTYSVEASALQTTMSQISVREWSYGLRVPVRYDILSLQAAQSQQFLNQNVALRASNLAQGQKNISTALDEVMLQSFDPFQVAELVLKLVGAVNSDDIEQKVENVNGDFIKFPKLAIQMPSIPTAILQRLGLKIKDPKSPFSSGFVKVLSGIQSEKVENDGTWNGIWKDTSIDEYKEVLEEGYKKLSVRPKIPGIGTLLQSGASAWDILNQFTENTLNESYTDMLYEEDETGDIVGKPVLVVRDKPFLLKTLKDNPPIELANQFSGGQPDLNGWTLYDDIPRLFIPNEQIAGFRLNNNIVNSYNYIRVDYQTPAMSDNLTFAKSALAGVCRLGKQMERFGGNEGFAKTIYMGVSNLRDENPNAQSAPNITVNYFEQYFGIIKGLFTLWHAYDYRMAKGQMTIKDDNIPVSVGTNITFDIGNYKLCAHVDSINYTYQIEQDGLEQSVGVIQFSRLVRVMPDGSLQLLLPSEFGNLRYSKPAPKALLPTALDAIGSFINKWV